ncbi:hypothetical protein CDO73_19750 [Saccharibacillus sp. O23]|uniref:DUF4129 domain-containing protein n=1 Tax=Saccharibacillus sp. O23 TaxID=2009338 RepID=UPI000B4E1E26|nr:DUF4129 domain-containing protein [Saccharibacillus sp. O23]OWR28118.1 hypothetical protein CDO73_19750 [Saccharibacillus sp. O23]
MKKTGLWNTALRSALGETLPIYPLLLILAVYVIEIPPVLLWAAFGLGVLGGGVAAKRLRREPAYPASAALPILLVAAIAASQPEFALGQIFCLLIVLLIAGSRGVYREFRIPPSSRAETLAASAWLAAGIVLYRLSFVLKLGLSEYRFSLYLSCALTLALILLRRNTHRVRESQGLSASEEMPANRLLYANRGFVAVLLLLIVGAGLLFPSNNPFGGLPRAQETQGVPVVADGSAPTREPAVECLILYEKERDQAEQEGRPVSIDRLPPQCQQDYADAANERDDGSYKWIDWVVAISAAASIVPAAYYSLRFLFVVFGEWLPDWFKRLLANLRITAGIESREDEEAYRDTTEIIGSRRSGKVRSGLSRFAEPASGPRRDYFRLVREAVRRGYAFRPWLTPSETGRELAAQPAYRELDETQVEQVIERYNQTRYAEKPKQGDG